MGKGGHKNVRAAFAYLPKNDEYCSLKKQISKSNTE